MTHELIPTQTGLTLRRTDTLISITNKLLAQTGIKGISQMSDDELWEWWLGLNSKDALVYFDKHKTIDPHHTYELVEALRFQTPRLTKNEISLIYKGSQLAIKVAILAYDRMHRFYQENQNIEQ